MRKFFFFLLVANIVFFVWMNTTKPEVNSRSAIDVMPAQERNTLPIMLLNEMIEPSSKVIASSSVESDEYSLLGGFTDEEQAKALLQRLMSLNIGGEVVERASVTSLEYLVYIPAGESKRLALRVIDELQASKIDAALIEKGVLDNVILLGVFTQESAASRQIELARTLGYQAEIKKVIKKQQRFWVSINADGQRLLDEQVIRSLVGDFAELEYVQE
ncbi:MAG: SPOR domain-containing protein [Thiopseudomonas sp.]|nr:SPOR domain-containing protein [Thiopseudomonas sp.]MCK9466669.1 SPOR domain-containing protein [Thiopseudomonas sp.]